MNIDFRFRISSFRLSIVLFFLVLNFSCNRSQTKDSTKFTNYFRQGEQLYIKHCSNCHQSNGTGLGRLYPPINKSDFMDNNFSKVICLIRNGIQGELIVNGVNFNQPMPGIPSLTDLEVAEIATYIYNSEDHKRGIVEVKEVTRIMDQCE